MTTTNKKVVVTYPGGLSGLQLQLHARMHGAEGGGN